MKVDPLLFLQAETAINDAVKLMSNNFISTNIIDSSKFENWYDYKTEIQNAYNSNIIYASAILNQIKYDKITPVKDQLMKIDSSFAAINLEFQNSLLDNSNLTNVEKERLQNYNEIEYNEEIKKLFENKKNLTKTEAITLYNVYISEQNQIQAKLNKEKNPDLKYDLTLELYQKAQKANDVLINYYNNKSWNALSNEDIKIFQELKNQNASIEESSNLLKSSKNLSKAQYNYENVKGILNVKEKTEYREDIKKNISEQIKSYEKLKSLTKDPNEIKAYDDQINYLKETFESYKTGLDAIAENYAQWSKAVGTLIEGDYKSAFRDVNIALAGTMSTGAVVAAKDLSGIFNIFGSIIDGVAGIGGNIVAGVVDIAGNKKLSSEIKDNVLDFQRKEYIDKFEKKYFEETTGGKLINGFSNLKYNSEGANTIENVTTDVGKIAAAVGLSILSEGAAIPAVVGFFYGAGDSGEEYAESINREAGEQYNYKEAGLRTIAGGLSEASSWYAMGNAGAQLYNTIGAATGAGVKQVANIGKKGFLKSFGKNLVDLDNILDTGALVASGAADIASGKSFEEMLKDRWLEGAFVIGANTLSSLLGAGIEARMSGVSTSDVSKNISATILEDASLETVDTLTQEETYHKMQKIIDKFSSFKDTATKTAIDIKSKVNALAINLNSSAKFQNFINSPIFSTMIYDPSTMPAGFIGGCIDVMNGKRAVQSVLDSDYISKKILDNGIVHLTTEEAADAIMDSKVLRASGNIMDRIVNQGKKSFFFAGGDLDFDDVITNLDTKAKMVGVKIMPNDDQIAKLGYRYLDDNAIINNGDFDLSLSKNAEKVYYGLSKDENGKLFFKELTKTEYDNYNFELSDFISGGQDLNKIKIGAKKAIDNLLNNPSQITELNESISKNLGNTVNSSKWNLTNYEVLDNVCYVNMDSVANNKSYSRKFFLIDEGKMQLDDGRTLYKVRLSEDNNIYYSDNDIFGILKNGSEDSKKIVSEQLFDFENLNKSQDNFNYLGYIGVDEYGKLSKTSIDNTGTNIFLSNSSNLSKTELKTKKTIANILSNNQNLKYKGETTYKIGGYIYNQDIDCYKFHDTKTNRDIFIQKDFKAKYNLNKAIEALNDLDTNSPTLSSKIRKIILSAEKNPEDAYWSSIHNTDFVSSAAAGEGNVLFYNSSTDNLLLRTLYHEAGHCLDENNIISNSIEWQKAAYLDQNFCSKYAAESFNARSDGRYAEDFAEALQNYRRMGEDNFKKIFPNRYNYLKTYYPDLIKLDDTNLLDKVKAKLSYLSESINPAKGDVKILYENTNAKIDSPYAVNFAKTDDITVKLDDITEPLSFSKNNIILDDITEEIVELKGIDKLDTKSTKVNVDELNVKNTVLTDENPIGINSRASKVNVDTDITIKTTNNINMIDELNIQHTGRRIANLDSIFDDNVGSKNVFVGNNEIKLTDEQAKILKNSFISQGITAEKLKTGDFKIDNLQNVYAELADSIYKTNIGELTETDRLLRDDFWQNLSKSKDDVGVINSFNEYIKKLNINEDVIKNINIVDNDFSKQVDFSSIFNETSKNKNIRIGSMIVDDLTDEQITNIRNVFKENGITEDMLLKGNIPSNKVEDICYAIEYEFAKSNDLYNKFSNYPNIKENFAKNLSSIYDCKNRLNNNETMLISLENYFKEVNNLIETDKKLSDEIIDIIVNKKFTPNTINEFDLKYFNEHGLEGTSSVFNKLSFMTDNFRNIENLKNMPFEDKEMFREFLNSGVAKAMLLGDEECIDAVALYTSGIYKEINSYLDTGVDIEVNLSSKTIKTSEIVEKINSIMESNKLDRTYIFQRSTDIGEFPELKGKDLEEIKGKIFTTNRSKSTCINYIDSYDGNAHGIPIGSDGSVEIDFVCPQGSKGLNVGVIANNDIEREFLIGGNQKIRYDEIIYENGNARVLAVVIPEGYPDNISIKELVDEDTYNLISKKYNLENALDSDVVKTAPQEFLDKVKAKNNINNVLKENLKEEIFKLDDITEPMNVVKSVDDFVTEPMSLSKNEFVLKDDITLDDITEEIVELKGIDKLKQKVIDMFNSTKAKVSETKSIFKENIENLFNDTKAKISKINDKIINKGAVSLENSKNLKNSIIDNMPSNLSDEEKARYIYMELNKRVNYDTNYALGNDETLKELTYNQELTLENFENLDSNRVICKGWSELYQELLKEANINGTIKIMGNNSVGAHKWIEINLNNGKKIFADSTQGYTNYLTDLVNCKSGNKTGGFLIFNNDIEINATGKKGIEQVKNLSNQADDLSVIDKKLGYTRNDRYYRESLSRLEEKFKNDSLIDKLLGNNKMENKVSKTVEMINSSKMGETEAYAYLKRQKNNLFGENASIDIIIDSDSGNYRPILSYLDSNGTIQYQLFTKENGFEIISKQELESIIEQNNVTLRDNKVLGLNI